MGLLCDEKEPDFLCISEHWLAEDEVDVVEIMGYVKVSSFCRRRHIHGGTAIYARRQLAACCEALPRYCNLSVEFSFECSAIVFNKLTCILCLYRSQIGNLDLFVTRLSDILGDICGRKFGHVILCGDFNINSLTISPGGDCLYDIFASYGLTSLILAPTRVFGHADGTVTESGLDYVVTNIPNECIISCENFEAGFSDHHAQLLTWAATMVSEVPERRSIEVRVMKELNFSEFKRLFLTVDNFFGNFINSLGVACEPLDFDPLFDSFWDHLLWCFSAAFPKVKKTICDYNPFHNKIVFSDYLNGLMSDMKTLNYLRKNFSDPFFNDCYKSKRVEVNRQIDAEKKAFYNNILCNSRNKLRTTWQLVNGSRSSHSGLQIKQNGQLLESHQQISDAFGHYFATIVSDKLQNHFGGSLSQLCTITKRNTPESLFIGPVTADEIDNVIRSLPNKKSTGYDEIPSFFVKKCSGFLCEILAELFNISVRAGRFPQALKLSVVVPVPKKGDLHDISNYRPIALLSIFSKIFERVMADKIYKFLDEHGVLGCSQHGFRKGYSTETATIQLIQHIYDCLDLNNFVIGIFFDLSRAFDTLHPSFVSEKISKMGIRGVANDWILSFLADRNFIVKVKDSKSNSYPQDIGTPQGSILGPLIFLMFVNDLPEYISEGRVFAYADDTTVIVSGPDLDGVCRGVTRVVDDFQRWCESNRLIINSDKTVFVKFRSSLHRNIHISLNAFQKPVVMETSVRFLGIMLDCDLTWRPHVDMVAKRLNSAYYAISQLKHKLDRKTVVTVYYGIFFPHLAYCVSVWGLSPEVHRLFILQKRVIRLIFNLDSRQSCRGVFVSGGFLTLTSIYLQKTLVYIHVNKNKLPTQACLHDHDTRQKDNLCLRNHAHSYYKRSPYYSGIRLYNMLPMSLKQVSSINVFKRHLKGILCRGCYYSVPEFVEGMRDCNGGVFI